VNSARYLHASTLDAGRETKPLSQYAVDTGAFDWSIVRSPRCSKRWVPEPLQETSSLRLAPGLLYALIDKKWIARSLIPGAIRVTETGCRCSSSVGDSRELEEPERVRVCSRVDTVAPMCQKITCGTCDKPSWSGCGAHVEQILGDVAVEDRCACSAADQTTKRGGFLSRLLGRS
jgi:hypothetical protein